MKKILLCALSMTCLLRAGEIDDVLDFIDKRIFEISREYPSMDDQRDISLYSSMLSYLDIREFVNDLKEKQSSCQ